ncbi:hypothetical protein PLICRDRAFT_123391 [Plicaturopsis crispa FD-325 SS-3]|nr:hypothetical protein PLICRDRAFT_123391 [Plicaturopsis crispa FD-325 SS-3]
MSNHTPRDALPALLYVTSEPSTSLPIHEFHDWYDNEHVPLRMALPYVQTGRRYEATDGRVPRWLALYDIESTKCLHDASYTRLRAERSNREESVMNRLDILDRRVYTCVSSRGVVVSAAPILVSVEMRIAEGDEARLDKWYEEEHIPLLAMIPGWQRTRRFRQVSDNAQVELLALHEYTEDNGLGGPEHTHAISTPWRTEVQSLVESLQRRTYVLYREFYGPESME